MDKVEFIEKFKARTKQLSIDVIKFYDQLNKTDSIRIIGKQLVRSVTSTAANYRAACIARSQAEFFAKMSIVTEEADETIYWLEVLRDTELANEESITPLLQESIEISKVVSKARKNVKR
ncbi:four helix bundle protein [Roseivirga sp. 4D4]|uniref:four helix bundle protein n=1 Tax=Roseivirga sp. 4D4 TaxID=1889784 RepID=UPI000853EF0A|nr:four helix bundle protein [Roseivirga sp. 4D4]OEK03174.1 four helix bundle protein [Roseivirga sp. 4D4]